MRLRWLVAGMACLALAGPVPAQNAPPVAKPALVTGPSANTGTGFVVAPGHVLTAHHVIQGRPQLLVGPTAQGKWVVAELVHSDPKLDLALLKAQLDRPALPLASSAEVPVGLEISVIGYPQPKVQGLSKKITQGIVNGYRSERQNAQDVGHLQISAEVSKGNSGGPVFAADGSVIGLVQRKVNASKVAEQTEDWVVNVSYALRSSQLIQFLQGAGLNPQVQPLSLDKVLRPYQLFEQKQGSVLAVMGRGSAPAATPAE
jgi:serine protease Do